MKRSLYAVLMTLVMSLMFSQVASAQAYNFNALNGATGFAVSMTKSGNLWTINSVKALAGPQSPLPAVGDVGQISIAWFDSAGGVLGSQVLTPTGDLALNPGTSGVNPTFDWIASKSGNTTRFTAGDGLKKNGTNVFSTSPGIITVNDPNLKSFTFDVQNGVQYQANIDLVPEANSALLLTMALAPLALLFWRRSRAGPRLT